MQRHCLRGSSNFEHTSLVHVGTHVLDQLAGRSSLRYEAMELARRTCETPCSFANIVATCRDDLNDKFVASPPLATRPARGLPENKMMKESYGFLLLDVWFSNQPFFLLFAQLFIVIHVLRAVATHNRT